MQTFVAEIGEIVRAQRRDEEELDELRERISRVVKELAGQRVWIRLFPYIPSLAKAAYYSCTLLSGVQTLGEEYVKVFETAGAKRNSPRFSARAVFVILHVFAPLVSHLVIQKALRKLHHPSTSKFLGISIRDNQKARRSFQRLFEWISTIGIPQLHRIHLAVFYIFGAYYNLSRRVTNIRFVSLSPQTDIGALKVYKFLGYLTLTQTAISIIFWLVSVFEEERNRLKEEAEKKKGKVNGTVELEQKKEESFSHSWFRCPVCLEAKTPSTTPCGHLFCWSCIQEHAISSSQEEAKCPNCRTTFQASQVVPLLNL